MPFHTPFHIARVHTSPWVCFSLCFIEQNLFLLLLLLLDSFNLLWISSRETCVSLVPQALSFFADRVDAFVTSAFLCLTLEL